MKVVVKVVATILAGGEGTRLRPYTDIIPKPMIPLGVEEKPILEYIVRWLKRYGITHIIFLVGYRWKQIRNYFGDGLRFGVDIRYSIDTEVYKGTGGALLNAHKQGLLNGDVILIWYGDIIAPIDIERLVLMHIDKHADAVMVLADRYRIPVGVAKVEEGRVVYFEEKPWLNLYASIAILTLAPKVLTEAEKYLGTSFDIMGNLIPWMIDRNYGVYAYIYDGVWYDIGSIDQYKKLNLDAIKEFVQD